VNSVLKYASPDGSEDRLLTVILDGENAWESYRFDNDGKEFLNAMYRKLTELDVSGQIKTITPTEYLEGNSARNILATSYCIDSKGTMALAGFVDQCQL